jgi:hypothetical protein
VDNVVAAIHEPRTLTDEEQAELTQLTQEVHRRLPADYQWLKDWEYV